MLGRKQREALEDVKAPTRRLGQAFGRGEGTWEGGREDVGEELVRAISRPSSRSFSCRRARVKLKRPKNPSTKAPNP